MVAKSGGRRGWGGGWGEGGLGCTRSRHGRRRRTRPAPRGTRRSRGTGKPQAGPLPVGPRAKTTRGREGFRWGGSVEGLPLPLIPPPTTIPPWPNPQLSLQSQRSFTSDTYRNSSPARSFFMTHPGDPKSGQNDWRGKSRGAPPLGSCMKCFGKRKFSPIPLLSFSCF